MRLHHLRPPPGAKRDPKRMGRGRSAGQGKTAGRGTKGYLAKHGKKPGYEGGQMPLARRVPKVKTQPARMLPRREEWAVVNLDRLTERFEAGTTVTPEDMAGAGLVRPRLPVKVLGRGEIDRALTVQAHQFSRAAKEKIEQAGGTAETLG
jgi:large subunit ribosomal protein L15